MSNSDQSISYGIHAVKALLNRQSGMLDQIILVKTKKPMNERLKEVERMAIKSNVPLRYMSQEALESSDLLQVVENDGAHQNIFAIVNTKQTATINIKKWLASQKDKASVVLVLDQVTDPHNLGACLRSADATGVDLVVVPKNNSATINATVRKVAAGAADNVPFLPVSNVSRFIADLKSEGYWVYGLADQGATSLFDHTWSDKVVVVMGAEGKGVRRLVQEECDELVAIPMLGSVESLNVSVATGVVLYDICRFHHKK